MPLPKEVAVTDQFQQLYDTRESLRLQQAGATESTAGLFGGAIDAATAQLAELAKETEVQSYLSRLGGTAVRSIMELERIEETGLANSADIESKRQELDNLRADPLVRMALEFLIPEKLPEAEPTRPRRFATSRQIEFARSLELDVTEDTPRGLASRMIEREVRRRSRMELKRGGWELDMYVDHPRHGKCVIVRVHEKIARVTLEPLKGGKKFVVAGMHLADWSPVSR